MKGKWWIIRSSLCRKIWDVCWPYPLTIDNGKVIDKKAWLYDTNDLPAIDGEQKEVNALYDKGKNLLSHFVVTLKIHFLQKKEIAQLLCEAMKRMVSCGLCFYQ